MTIPPPTPAPNTFYIRSMHSAQFRSGQWAKVVGIGMYENGAGLRVCYVVEFVDGVTDYWVVDDPVAEYEFSRKATREQ